MSNQITGLMLFVSFTPLNYFLPYANLFAYPSLLPLMPLTYLACRLPLITEALSRNDKGLQPSKRLIGLPTMLAEVGSSELGEYQS
jgi:hypothetical protein